MTDDLASYLLARLDEDEQVARQAEAVIPDGEGWYRVAQLAVADPEWAKRYGHAYTHIARWDPARVLAEVEAKRRIVELHPPVQGDGTPYRGGVLAYCMSCADWSNADPYEGGPMVDYPCPTLRLLAQPYADRDDFRDSFRI